MVGSSLYATPLTLLILVSTLCEHKEEPTGYAIRPYCFTHNSIANEIPKRSVTLIDRCWPPLLYLNMVLVVPFPDLICIKIIVTVYGHPDFSSPLHILRSGSVMVLGAMVLVAAGE